MGQATAGGSTAYDPAISRNSNPLGARRGGFNRTGSTGRPLSSNYRWRDWNDVLRDDGINDEHDDINDEEYEDAPQRFRDQSISDD
eukprot:975571-Ditylum_brightwellii.AAC.1